MNSGRLYRKICTREVVSELELVWVLVVVPVWVLVVTDLVLGSAEVLVLGSVEVLVLEMFELV